MIFALIILFLIRGKDELTDALSHFYIEVDIKRGNPLKIWQNPDLKWISNNLFSIAKIIITAEITERKVKNVGLESDVLVWLKKFHS